MSRAAPGPAPGVPRPATSRESPSPAEPETQARALRIFLRLIRPRPLADPYPLYAQLRDQAPFLPIRFPGMPVAYLVTTFASCSRLLREPAFGPPTYAQLDALNPGWRDNAFISCVYRSMVMLSGPAHRARRQVASRPFTPRQSEAFRGQLAEITELLLDRLAGHGPGPVDLVEELAMPFASLSLGRLLAIADDEALRLGQLTRQLGVVFEQFASASQRRNLVVYGEELVQGLAAVLAGRHGSEDNLLARLAASQAEAGSEEQLGMAVLLFGAGFDSPASMVGLGTRLLLEHPEQALLLAADDGLAPNAVAEILRYEPPVQLVVRTALEPAELAGTQIEPGSMILGLVAAANRDPVQVKEPEVFDVTRERVPSLSFGAGPHYCLGAYLTGMQGEALFPRLLRRFPRLRLAGRPAYRSPGSTLRGLESLPVYLELGRTGFP
ncbi:MAG: cytochrome P450 [Streptosporangiaceae bacterium]|jgi:cytochrome P450